MAKDLYAILGLAKDASPDDIKKAYRKQSKEWHPDKHKGDKKAEDHFKEINEAYEVLGNPEKKRMYDQFGSTGGPSGGGGQGFGGFDFSGFGGSGDMGDIFESFFSGMRGQTVDPTQGTDREIEITISLKDAFAGARYPLRMQRLVSCERCSGNGAEPGTNIDTCTTCGGTGQTVRTMNSFFGRIQQRGICPTCSGSGKVPKSPCKECKGEGRTAKNVDVTVDVPAGIDAGQILRIRGQGDAGLRGKPAGDLFVRIHVEADPRFEREGADIRSSVDVPVIDAILGGTVEVETVQGSATVQVPGGMQPGTVFRLRGKGLPLLSSSRFGDHYVTLNVEIPKKLSRAERKIVEEWKGLRE